MNSDTMDTCREALQDYRTRVGHYKRFKGGMKKWVADQEKQARIDAALAALEQPQPAAGVPLPHIDLPNLSKDELVAEIMRVRRLHKEMADELYQMEKQRQREAGE